ncbi:pyridoxamine 5'-phosphate oxidase family protein [Actinomyces ruminicola]|uniref:pyridoxamine 5'-phosphate oxidase family protein n=1 Tax=Actinomyces ruminicola TaxID=332524 RepID=UPI0037BFC1B1
MERVSTILDEHDMCVLGTVGAQEPRLTPCFFAPLDEHRLVFVSSKGSRHVAHMRADPHCSALVLPEQAEQGRLVSLLLAGEVTCPQGRSRLSALTSYMARMRSRLPSVSSSMRGLLDKKVFVLEVATIELVDTLLCGGTVRVGRGPRG